ncbi:unnamed protein product [Arabidopsis thaliana]|nr:unnamed protein product [Arabidopsis thaliana]
MTTGRNRNLSVARSLYYKNHHKVVITEMSNFNKVRRRSSRFRRKTDGDEEEEEKRSIPTGPNPLHNK